MRKAKDPFDNLTDEQKGKIIEVVKFLEDKEKSGEISFPDGIFHPKVLSLIRELVKHKGGR